MDVTGDSEPITAADEVRAAELLRAYLLRENERYWALMRHMLAEFDCDQVITAILALVGGALDHLDSEGFNPKKAELTFTALFITSNDDLVARHLREEGEADGWPGE